MEPITSSSPTPFRSTAFPTLKLFTHPLIQHKLTKLREKDTPTVLFRQLLRAIALLM